MTRVHVLFVLYVDGGFRHLYLPRDHPGHCRCGLRCTLWFSRATQPCIGLTVNYVDEQPELKSRCFKRHIWPGRKQVLYRALMSWGARAAVWAASVSKLTCWAACLTSCIWLFFLLEPCRRTACDHLWNMSPFFATCAACRFLQPPGVERCVKVVAPSVTMVSRVAVQHVCDIN